ncbi:MULTISPECIES: DUF6530 family protein [Paenibacillus]|uniref:DUF6530 family protein n=1 Tax=Paenibacillus TaxID=44249 RepID=UPI0022B8C3CD|nr:DUF6530 family protein [Paenibacillus caseinilyticus]MCZ8519429.1 DUF6530 family protein [Paenibacillus caseinilyticus]
MNIPTSLPHQPVIVSDNYGRVDGRYSRRTDVKGLSLGLTQGSDQGRTDISANLWRHPGEPGASPSEELPIHRVLDLAILICRSSLHFQDAYRYPLLYDPDQPMIDRIGLQGDAMNVSICTENPMIDQDIQRFAQVLNEDGDMIGERLRVLSQLLEELGY